MGVAGTSEAVVVVVSSHSSSSTDRLEAGMKGSQKSQVDADGAGGGGGGGRIADEGVVEEVVQEMGLNGGGGLGRGGGGEGLGGGRW